MLHVAVGSPLEAWANFYVILGSSAAALTGLQFVVMTLVAQAERLSGDENTLGAFGSPNVVHFCAALLVGAVLSAPWGALGLPGALVAVCGAAGLFYCGLVLRRAQRQTEYQPVFEDWLWHNILPPLAYAALLVAGVLLRGAPTGALFAIAGAVLLLVFVGIHNSWDTVTWVMLEQVRRRQRRAARPPVESTSRGNPPKESTGQDPGDTT